jgi:hypothetical protein
MCNWELILRPSHLKIQAQPLKFLERIQVDICGPIQPLSRLFRYFMVLIDASGLICVFYRHGTVLLQN